MRRAATLFICIFLSTSCSETNLDDLDEAELKEIEVQIEEDAKSLEEAAAEAVKILEEEIQADLDESGIGSAEEIPSESPDLQETEE